jgi:hypothetical protein
MNNKRVYKFKPLDAREFYDNLVKVSPDAEAADMAWEGLLGHYGVFGGLYRDYLTQIKEREMTRLLGQKDMVSSLQDNGLEAFGKQRKNRNSNRFGKEQEEAIIEISKIYEGRLTKHWVARIINGLYVNGNRDPVNDLEMLKADGTNHEKEVLEMFMRKGLAYREALMRKGWESKFPRQPASIEVPASCLHQDAKDGGNNSQVGKIKGLLKGHRLYFDDLKMLNPMDEAEENYYKLMLGAIEAVIKNAFPNENVARYVKGLVDDYIKIRDNAPKRQNCLDFFKECIDKARKQPHMLDYFNARKNEYYQAFSSGFVELALYDDWMAKGFDRDYQFLEQYRWSRIKDPGWPKDPPEESPKEKQKTIRKPKGQVKENQPSAVA